MPTGNPRPPVHQPSWAWPLVAVIGMILLFLGWGLHAHPKETLEILGGLVFLSVTAMWMLRI